MLPLLALALQSAQPVPLGDIVIGLSADVRSLHIDPRGTSSATATATPDGGSTSLGSGTRSSQHFELRIDARLADPALAPPSSPADATEPSPPR